MYEMVILATDFGGFEFSRTFWGLWNFNLNFPHFLIFQEFQFESSWTFWWVGAVREKVRENSNSANPAVSIPTSYIFCALGFTKVYFQILIKDFERSRLYFSNIGHKRHLVSKCNSPFTLSPTSWSFSSENKNLSAPFSATTTANFL